MSEQASPSPEILLSLIASGDATAFSAFYDRFAATLYAVALRTLRDMKESEDIVQEVFLQIWQNARAFDAELGSAASWAVTMTRNRAIDRIRTSHRRAELLELRKEDLRPDPMMVDALEVREDSQRIRSAVSALPREQRQAIELAFFSGMSQTEISQFIEAPLGTVKARIRRGMSRLKEALLAHNPEPYAQSPIQVKHS